MPNLAQQANAVIISPVARPKSTRPAIGGDSSEGDNLSSPAESEDGDLSDNSFVGEIRHGRGRATRQQRRGKSGGDVEYDSGGSSYSGKSLGSGEKAGESMSDESVSRLNSVLSVVILVLDRGIFKLYSKTHIHVYHYHLLRIKSNRIP